MRANVSPTSPVQNLPSAESGADNIARTGLAALLHRLNGGLNNAAIACELLQEQPRDSATSKMVDAGLVGVLQASRAAKLIEAVEGFTSAARLADDDAYLRDVIEILSVQASRAGCTLVMHPTLLPHTLTHCSAVAAADSLLRGLAALHEAGAGRLEIAVSARAGVEELEYRLPPP